MTERTLAWVLVVAIIIWMLQLVWLFWFARQRRADPFRTVSGAAIFFVAAAPVALGMPGVVDSVARLWERVVPDRSGGGRAAHVPARLLISGEQQPIDQPRVRLGRYPNNEIVLDHSTVSAYHAEIIQRPDGRHEIVDRESRNGTRVNGALVRNQVLRDGDLITLGAASIHYLSESSTDGGAFINDRDGVSRRDRDRDQRDYDDDEYYEDEE